MPVLEDARDAAGSRTRIVRLVWAVGLVLVLLAYVLRLDHVCALFVDDGWYVILAKALATGQGYELLNAPSGGIVPFYPPGHPMLLSLIFRLAPDFPANVWLLKSVSIAAMLGVAVLTRRYGERHLGLDPLLAVVLALATALQGGFVFLATSTVMSECVFALTQLAAVVLVEQVARERGGALTALVGGAIAGYAFLVRSMAIGLIGAAGLYLLLRRRRGAAIAFGVGAVAVAAPWVLYAAAHAATPEQQLEVNDYVVFPYSTHFWMALAGHPGRGFVTAADLPRRVLHCAYVVSRAIVSGIVVYPLTRMIEYGEWGEVTELIAWSSHGLTALGVIGLAVAVRRRPGLAEIFVPVSLLIVFLWPFFPFRFVLPLTPFLLYYVLLGFLAVFRFVARRDGRTVALAAFAAIIAADLGSHFNHWRKLRGLPAGHPTWVRIFDEHAELLAWVREHIPLDQPVVAVNPGETYLYTGRKAVGYWQTEGTWREWKRLGIHYMVDVSFPEKNGNLLLMRFPPVLRTKEFDLQILDLGRIYQPH